ncbi:MAG: PIN domain-containing protein [Nocardioides sp.]|uniref:type II toxin-antitoxin system VapC family toxin n=1 Tax=Nocardioides sp. TaxID=35761 RepID=UPI0039E6AE0B
MSERVLVDTNVFVHAYDARRSAHHHQARSLLESDPRALAASHQSMREFLAVATRPVASNGYGVHGPAAARAWRALTGTIDSLVETKASQSLLLEFVDAGLASSRQVHDANLVAVALDHGATTLITDNVRHFERFAHLIRIEPLDG